MLERDDEPVDKHRPFTDDGVTYCGFDGHDGCGELWPCSTVRHRREDYPERAPGFVLGYLEGWDDSKAGRQYGEGRGGQRSGLVGQDGHEGCRAITRAKVAMYVDWLREHHPDCSLLAENIVDVSSPIGRSHADG